MTLMTYTPPPRKNRRRRYDDNVKYEPKNQIVVLVRWGFKRKRNHPSWNRHYNRGRMPMKISPRVGIRKITMDPRSGPEVIRTFPVVNIHNFSTDRSRSRSRHGPEVIQTFPAWNIHNFSADRSWSR